ncbi:tRNA (guanine-N(1)-)-methyltransferase [Striga asiatica]|uniref:tRNA (Guanine-N(1)-)-methyltransferase n=1 Tax=Striga asiatica TaxID=4170 RepID=A0A5A7RED4_STRAF|nr:tRNA (guanine-N(1)-)-methyltransferase [Striga asiatica]
MEPSLVQTTPSVEDDDDEWDTEGFVIPSLGIEDPDHNKTSSEKVEDSIHSKVEAGKEENIYLGPHGAPPSQAKQQELNPLNRKQKFKQKLKEADRRYSGSGRENKVDNLRELVGGGKMAVTPSKISSREWLDPHCHESQFERRNLH